ncbi:uncharacterized protein EI90DRAFT_2256358 [Cantharellus anzutake]|uniref:uncharacterized protein n=1 Tax=Cantharellus anzutake TaxID=1750568 RepID=UPI001907453A|nr:uncharacterized protein EI90DRAFT_2256358 [Cantharellus anzutake]KAF8339599.1 hypothetical protein EI90DRAFT_2256358 [Cantharellus anzutake]
MNNGQEITIIIMTPSMSTTAIMEERITLLEHSKTGTGHGDLRIEGDMQRAEFSMVYYEVMEYTLTDMYDRSRGTSQLKSSCSTRYVHGTLMREKRRPSKETREKKVVFALLQCLVFGIRKKLRWFLSHHVSLPLSQKTAAARDCLAPLIERFKSPGVNITNSPFLPVRRVGLRTEFQLLP